MKYKEIKDALLSKGWSLEYIQTSGELEMLHFEHPTIKGMITVDFNSDIELPQNILDGEEFNYITSEFLNDYKIAVVEFDKDMGISYMSDEVIDSDGSRFTNRIYLYQEDIDKLFHKVLAMMDNPNIILDFQKEFNQRVIVFNDKIQKYFDVLKEFGIVSPEFNSYGGNECTIFRNYCIYFKVDGSKYDTVDFNFDIFNDDKHEIVCVIGVEKYFTSIDTPVEDFRKRFSEIMEEFERLKVLRLNKQKEIY